MNKIFFFLPVSNKKTHVYEKNSLDGFSLCSSVFLSSNGTSYVVWRDIWLTKCVHMKRIGEMSASKENLKCKGEM